MSKSKLWKNIGISKEKYQRDSELSPSYERSSVGKSIQNKTQSSHSLRLLRMKKDNIQKRQDNNLNQAMKLFVNKHFTDESYRLRQVQQQQDIYPRHITLQKVKFQSPYTQDELEKELLQQLTKNIKKNSFAQISQKNIGLPKLKQTIHKLNQYQIKLKEYVKVSMKNFGSYIQRVEQNLREVIKNLIKQLAVKNYEINQLHQQNQELRKELLKAFEIVQQSHMSHQIKHNLDYLKIRMNKQIISPNNTTICKEPKYSAIDQQISRIHNTSLLDPIIQFQDRYNLHNNTHITSQELLKRVNPRQSSNNRQKFKQFLQNKHSAKKTQIINPENDKKSESLPNKNIYELKFCKTQSSIQKKTQPTFSNNPILTQKFYKYKNRDNLQNPTMIRYSSGHE